MNYLDNGIAASVNNILISPVTNAILLQYCIPAFMRNQEIITRSDNAVVLHFDGGIFSYHIQVYDSEIMNYENDSHYITMSFYRYGYNQYDTSLKSHEII